MTEPARPILEGRGLARTYRLGATRVHALAGVDIEIRRGDFVVIQGPSGSGKTTIAKLVAKELGIHYLDTGALYRTAALALINHDIKAEDSDDKIQSILDKTQIAFINGRAYLNGKDVSEDIRSAEIDTTLLFSLRELL